MTEHIVAIIMVFSTIMVLGIGIPLIVGFNRRRMLMRQGRPAARDSAIDERLSRIETAVDTMSIELERVAEGQRFVTRLLSEQRPIALPMGGAEPAAVPVRAPGAEGRGS